LQEIGWVYEDEDMEDFEDAQQTQISFATPLYLKEV
jgi:hypothetical protein